MCESFTHTVFFRKLFQLSILYTISFSYIHTLLYDVNIFIFQRPIKNSNHALEARERKNEFSTPRFELVAFKVPRLKSSGLLKSYDFINLVKLETDELFMKNSQSSTADSNDWQSELRIQISVVFYWKSDSI